MFCSECGRLVEGPAIVDGDRVRHANCPGARLDSPVVLTVHMVPTDVVTRPLPVLPSAAA